MRVKGHNGDDIIHGRTVIPLRLNQLAGYPIFSREGVGA